MGLPSSLHMDVNPEIAPFLRLRRCKLQHGGNNPPRSHHQLNALVTVLFLLIVGGLGGTNGDQQVLRIWVKS